MKRKIMGASVRGLFHEQMGIANQDAFALKFMKSYAVMVVADGVSLTFDGKISKSEVASRLVCKEAMFYLRKALRGKKQNLKHMIQNCFRYVEKQLRDYVGKDKDPSDYMTTLIIGIVDRKGNLYYGSVGDGGIFCIVNEEDVSIVTPLKTSNMVHTLFEESYWSFGVIKNVRALCMATDGIFDEFTKPLRCDRYVPMNLQFVNYLFGLYRDGEVLKDAFQHLGQSVTTDDKTAILYFHSQDKIKEYDYEPLTEEQKQELSDKAMRRAFGGCV